MFYVGRVKRLVALGVLLSYCLTGVGCYLSLNYDLDKPPQPGTPAKPGGPVKPGDPSRLPDPTIPAPAAPSSRPPSIREQRQPTCTRTPPKQARPDRPRRGPSSGDHARPGGGPRTASRTQHRHDPAAAAQTGQGVLPAVPRRAARHLAAQLRAPDSPAAVHDPAARLPDAPGHQHVPQSTDRRPVPGAARWLIVLGYSYGSVRVGGMTLEQQLAVASTWPAASTIRRSSWVWPPSAACNPFRGSTWCAPMAPSAWHLRLRLRRRSDAGPGTASH